MWCFFPLKKTIKTKSTYFLVLSTKTKKQRSNHYHTAPLAPRFYLQLSLSTERNQGPWGSEWLRGSGAEDTRLLQNHQGPPGSCQKESANLKQFPRANESTIWATGRTVTAMEGNIHQLCVNHEFIMYSANKTTVSTLDITQEWKSRIHAAFPIHTKAQDNRLIGEKRFLFAK